VENVGQKTKNKKKNTQIDYQKQLSDTIFILLSKNGEHFGFQRQCGLWFLVLA